MSALIELATFISSATEEFRKGEEVSQHKVGNLAVVELYAMPHESEAHTGTVDVGFVQVGFTEAAADRDGFLRLLKAALAEPGEFYAFTVKDFLGGPSYITTGAWIGSQDLALRLYALLAHYELAKVVLPSSLRILGPEASELMGSGFVFFAPTPQLREELVS